MKKQPDFRQLFHDYFGSEPKKVTYGIRQDSNRYHDLVFLVSLIHDARFRRKELSLRGKKLTIRVNRDCWELGFQEHQELHIADSRLSISPVFDLEWRFRDENVIGQDDELWILDVRIQRVSYEILRVVLVGDSWSLHMKATDDDFKMSIHDLEVPYLYSQKG